MGGIVNGVIRDYKVADSSGIEMGDYVQLVKGSGVRQSANSVVAKDYYNNLPVYTFAYQNKVLWFYFPNYSSDCDYYAFVEDVNPLGLVGTPVSTVLYLKTQEAETEWGYQSSGAYSRQMFEVSEGEYLILFYNRIANSSNVFGAKFLKYNGDTFTTSTVTVNNTTSFALNFVASKIDNSHVVLQSGSGVAIASFNKANLTMTIGTVVAQTQPSNTLVNPFVTNKFIYSDVKSYSYNLSTLTLTLAKTNTVAISSRGVLLQDGLAASFGISQKSYDEDNATVSCTKYVLSSDGSISSATVSYKVGASYYSNGSYSNAISFNVVSNLDGKLLFAVNRYMVNRSSGSSTYSYSADDFCVLAGVYNQSTGEFVFEDLVELGFTGSSNQTALLGSQFVQSNGNVYFVSGYTTANPSTTGTKYCYPYIAAFKLNGTQVVPIGTIDEVVKYATRISGVAKTSGSLGDTIKVYSPE
jgi:hypothetical protein